MSFKNIKSLLLVFILLLFSSGILSAQEETDETKNKPVVLNPKFSGSRGYTGAFAKDAQALNGGLAQYLRFTVMDGNLVTGGIVNSGILSYHYVGGTPRLSWPKGPNSVEYLHSGVFFVAAEVVDDNGDTIHIVSDNYRRGGETALDQSHLYGFAPLPGYYNQHSTNATEWDIAGISEDVGIDGFPNTNDEGEGDGILQSNEDFNSNGILDLSMINGVNWFAVSHRKETWPEYWPVGTYPGDNRQPGDKIPGIRAGRWNGEFGAYVRADQESYYATDDRENDEFDYYPFDDAASRQPYPNGKRGLGITVEVRNYQWSARLSEDILISIYDIENKGKDLEKTIVGMYVDPDLGGSLSGDDASFDNVDDITYAFTSSGLASNGLPIGYFGFAFLESPGLGNDGQDNDEDGLVDESQTNGIDDDGDWETWTDENGNGVFDNEDVNFNGKLDPGEDLNNNGILDIEPLNDDLGSDGLGPNFDDYTGPDPDGTEGNGIPDEGEPDFEFSDNDESDQVGLTSFYLRDVDNTMANDERYWSIEINPGIYTVRPGYQRDIAWSYGSGYVKFSGNEKEHRYAIALLFGNDEPDILRNKKTMQVIYDEDYNFTKPPRKPRVAASGGDGEVILTWDDAAEFSQDPVYGYDFEAYYIYKSTDPTFNNIKTITDAFGNPLLFKPEAIYDVKNGLTGIHPVRIGSELGADSDLGVTYNMGTDSGLKHNYTDTDVDNGRTYYYAVVSVDRGYHPDFYPELNDREGLLTISPTECSANIQIDLLGRAVSTDDNTVIVVPVEKPAGWVTPKVDEEGVIHASGGGTGSISVSIYDKSSVNANTNYRVEFGDDGSFKEYGNAYTGITNRITLYNADTELPVFSVTDPDNNDRMNEFISDGIQIDMKNDTTKMDTAYWTSGNSEMYLIDFTGEDNGIYIPRDYEIRVGDLGVYTPVNRSYDSNFEVWDVTNIDSTFRVNYRYVPDRNEPDSLQGILSHKDKIQLVSDFSNTKRLWIFRVEFADSLTDDRYILPNSGDVLKIESRKAFTRNDSYTFRMTGNDINIEKAADDLSNIYTVPDPYIVSNTLERKVINESEGRGDRRIDFVNLPNECTIKIFTVSGKFVREITHSSAENNSRAIWDLRTKDGLEIAPGIYYYIVEAPGIGEKVGRLAVIK